MQHITPKTAEAAKIMGAFKMQRGPSDPGTRFVHRNDDWLRRMQAITQLDPIYLRSEQARMLQKAQLLATAHPVAFFSVAEYFTDWTLRQVVKTPGAGIGHLIDSLPTDLAGLGLMKMRDLT
jgi:hypothetical protein